MTRPIPDKAEVALEYPDKLYVGTFERSSRFDAHFEGDGIALILQRDGDVETRKSVHMHLHHALFAEIMTELAESAAAFRSNEMPHRETLREAALALYRSLDTLPANGPSARAAIRDDRRTGANDVAQMTPEDEVLLLHVME